jgi:phosphoribosylformylglycinamidine synthase II
VAVYQIEVRAIAEQHDVLAQRLAREILHLPLKHLPTLQSLPATTTPFTIRTAQLYLLTGTLTPSQIDQLTRQLLIDPVVQEARATARVAPTIHDRDAHSWWTEKVHIVDVFFHPGVTDTLAESILAGASMLGITGIEHVETGRRYLLDARLSEDEVRTIAEFLLYNPVIQQYTLYANAESSDLQGGGEPQGDGKGHPELSISLSDMADQRARAGASPAPTIHEDVVPSSQQSMGIRDHGIALIPIPLSNMTDQQLLELSRSGMLALSLDEMRAIQQHYREQGREPTDVELEALAQTWSEHCSHKTFKATIDYREVDGDGNVLARETIHGLLKQYIMRATEQVKRPWVVSAFSDNAGIVRYTDSQDIAFKVETHNHPSAIEPFGGANTGVGGVIRDVLGVSAQPIACTDILCFGPPDTPAEELPAGMLSPRRIASGVVNGVRDYGNKMGIPTVNGAILYHPGYMYNPLVFCGCLGILPHDSHPSQVQSGDHIVVLGGRTGRDGIHGATFSSGEMSSEINAQAGSAVQIGAPITEKKVTDVIIQARDRRLYHAITDCGAGGFSSAIGEMGAKTGAQVELTHAPLKYQGLAPWEIWLSEAQERMVLAVPHEHLAELLEICATEEVEASILGTFTNDHRLMVTHDGQPVADMDMEFLHDGRPDKILEAVWVRPNDENIDTSPATGEVPMLSSILLALLRHPTIASKEAVVRRYDHEVQGATVLKPLVGRAGNGPGDAAVLQPILDEPTVGRDESRPYEGEAHGAGIILSNGINPLYGKIDPYHMAMNAIDEALRNLTAVGGDIERAAILDNFCWGNPTDPVQLGMLVRAVKGCHDAAIGFGTPFISGKDSLNNEYRTGVQRLPVIPTLLISAVGVIDDAAQTIDMSLKASGDLLYLIGVTRNELAGSHYAEIMGGYKGSYPSIPDTETSCAAGAPLSMEAQPSEDTTSELVKTLADKSAVGTINRPLRDPASFHALYLGHSPAVSGTTVPQVDVSYARHVMKALGMAIRKGLVRACHDLSEGGLAVAAAEMALAGLLGLDIDLGRVLCEGLAESADINTILLFSESASRFLVEVSPEQRDAFEAHWSSWHPQGAPVQDVAYIGTVTDADRFIVRNGEQELIDIPVTQLQQAWKKEEVHNFV